MVLRDKNHPSIIIWSLGNESGLRPQSRRPRGLDPQLRPLAAAPLRGCDTTRKGLKAEGRFPGGQGVTDIIRPMYPSIESLIDWAKTSNDSRPLIMCEYAHSMGNSHRQPARNTGTRSSRTTACRAASSGTGSTRAFARRTARATPYWAYGGDFGDEPNDENFCCNGLVWPDRTPHPALFEFKKLVQPVGIREKDLRSGTITIQNKQYFTDLSGLAGSWELLVDGVVVSEGRLPVLKTPPGESEEVSIGLPKPELLPGQESFLLVRFVMSHDTKWAGAGHEVAWEQFALPFKAPKAKPVRREGHLEVARTRDLSVVTGEGFEVRIDRKAARLTSLKWEGRELLYSGPVLSIFRAPTDNDGIKLIPEKNHGALRGWLDAGLDRLQIVPKKAVVKKGDGGTAIVILENAAVSRKIGQCFTHLQEYTIHPGGDMRVTNTIKASGKLPELPRIGVVLTVVKELEQFHWFGRGPHESYVDRKAGAAVGLYSGTVDEQYVPYVMPQENGNKTDVRWLSLENEARGWESSLPLKGCWK